MARRSARTAGDTPRLRGAHHAVALAVLAGRKCEDRTARHRGASGDGAPCQAGNDCARHRLPPRADDLSRRICGTLRKRARISRLSDGVAAASVGRHRFRACQRHLPVGPSAGSFATFRRWHLRSRLGNRRRPAALCQSDRRHGSGANRLTHVLWTGKPTVAGATARNAVVYGEKAIDRSPCGTGTSARMAQWAAQGRLAVGDSFVHESIIGSLFSGRVEDAVRVVSLDAIVPSIGGWARKTRFNTIFIDDRDPFAHGFTVA
ncbi:proline racemase family protein [Jiella sp. KSK16Y-1]|uniref:4-hydroxyproline epimerase n=1 Tax=Jiella mangrovi TaxID=2821407 RepID=A0ABS4BL92_9HYPH|nr:proline racemase family protein [Jiella mangrovi]